MAIQACNTVFTPNHPFYRGDNPSCFKRLMGNLITFLNYFWSDVDSVIQMTSNLDWENRAKHMQSCVIMSQLHLNLLFLHIGVPCHQFFVKMKTQILQRLLFCKSCRILISVKDCSSHCILFSISQRVSGINSKYTWIISL